MVWSLDEIVAYNDVQTTLVANKIYDWAFMKIAIRWSTIMTPVEYRECYGLIGREKEFRTCCLSIRLLVRVTV